MTCLPARHREPRRLRPLAGRHPAGLEGLRREHARHPGRARPGLAADIRAGIAQFQAALTHGHPTALAASDLTAYACHRLRAGLRPADLLPALRARCADQRTVYHDRWLGDLWRRPGVNTPAAFIARGWDECAAALASVVPTAAGDPCLISGEGWTAEEALATALICYLATPDDPVTAIPAPHHLRRFRLHRVPDGRVRRRRPRPRPLATGLAVQSRIRRRSSHDRRGSG